jgi:hypothetical protein
MHRAAFFHQLSTEESRGALFNLKRRDYSMRQVWLDWLFPQVQR